MKTSRCVLSGSLLMATMTMTTMAAGFHCVTHAQLDVKLEEVKDLIRQLFAIGFHPPKGYHPHPPPFPPKGYPPPPPKGYPHTGKHPGGHPHGKGRGKKGHVHQEHLPGYGPVPHLFSTQFGNGQEIYYVGFVGKSCVGKSVYDLFTGQGHNDTFLSRKWCGCVSLRYGYNDDRCSCDHYKSILIDQWKLSPYHRDFLVKKVRVSVFTGGEEKAYFELGPQDGERELAYEGFFSQSNLLATSYEDLNSTIPINYFSIEGYHQRRFLVNKRHAGNCKKDEGWHALLDKKDPQDTCDWTDYEQFPVFLYSLNNRVQTWVKDDVGCGELFVISLVIVPRHKHYRYKPTPLPPHTAVCRDYVNHYIPWDCSPH